ncbi:MAG: 3-phosphoshikimate 1-carboxyvinyltransferase [bacterium]
MKLIVQSENPLRGEVIVPGDKSLSHRAALFAALAEGESVVDRFLVSGVTRAMLDVLTGLGVAWQVKEQRLTVCGTGLNGLRAPVVPLDCRNSATTIRLLAGAVAATGIDATLDGSAGLRRRPMNRIVEPLRRMGVEITPAANDCAPLHLHGRLPDQPIHTMDYTLPVASAQVKSCLLLAALGADKPVTLREPGPSRDHTERMLRAMGVRVETPAPHTVTLHPPTEPLQPLHMQLAGDISAAAFLIVAATITPGSEILLRDVGLNPTRTGLLDALRAMGADIRATNLREWSGEPVGDLLVRHSQLRATRVAGDLVVRMIDEFPVFAVAAACADGVTEVREAEELRHKESDRISALAHELQAIGVAIEPLPDGFRITGGPVAGGTVTPHGDHRIAMSCAVAGLVARAPVIVEGAEIMHESFPAFGETLQALRA